MLEMETQPSQRISVCKECWHRNGSSRRVDAVIGGLSLARSVFCQSYCTKQEVVRALCKEAGKDAWEMLQGLDLLPPALAMFSQ